MGRSVPAPTERMREVSGGEQVSTPRRRGRPPARGELGAPPAPHAAESLDMLPFGALLKLLRERRNLSQGALAERIGKSTSLISLFESEQRRPTSDTVADLVRALRLSDEEQRQVAQSAGFAEGDVSGAVVRIVDVLRQHLDLGEAERASLLADLDAQVTGWQALFHAARRFHTGEMETARQELERLGRQSEFSPALMTQVQVHLAEALSQTGQLAEAGDLVRAARRRREQAHPSPDWLPWEEAEVKSAQAMVAKRAGDYELAAALLRESIAVYERLLSGSDVDERIASAGLGRTYKQLAEVTLLQGEAAVALRFCANAEAHLSLARQTALTQQWLRRTLGLKAWACSLLQDFDRAEALRQLVRERCEAAGDHVGLAKNALFRGDDFRRRIRLALAASGDGAPERDPETRRKRLHDVLHSEDVSGWLEAARACYAEALVGLKEVSDRLLLGRAHRAMGITLRYKAIRDASEQDFDEAHRELDRALAIENSNGQQRRLPSIYESIAELEWDRGHLLSAASYYEGALEVLERALATSPDAASVDQRARIQAALQVLHPTDHLRLPHARRHEEPALEALGLTRWRMLSATLVRTIREFVTLNNTPLISLETDSPEWEEKTLELDVAPGPRILAQNRLSSSLALRLSGGSVPEAVARHVGRFHSFAARVQAAHERRNGEPSRDLCCRHVVEQALTTPATRLVTSEQIRTAYEYMTRYPDAYTLASCLYRLPLDFAVTGTKTLVEVPERLAGAFLGGKHGAYHGPGGVTLCYAFDSEALAEKLRRLFAELVEEAAMRVPNDTANWLKDLIEQPPRVRQESNAM